MEDQVAEAYLEVLGRLPDEKGLRTYKRFLLRKGNTINDLKQILMDSLEIRKRCEFDLTDFYK